MTLRVDPADVAAYAAQVKRAHEDANECTKYFDREVPETSWHGDGGVFNPLYAEHGEVRRTVRGVLTHMATLLESCGEELSKVGNYYRETDREAAAHLDATLPEVERPAVRKG